MRSDTDFNLGENCTSGTKFSVQNICAKAYGPCRGVWVISNDNLSVQQFSITAVFSKHLNWPWGFQGTRYWQITFFPLLIVCNASGVRKLVCLHSQVTDFFFKESSHCEAKKNTSKISSVCRYSRAQWQRTALLAVKWENLPFLGSNALLSAGWETACWPGGGETKGTDCLRYGQVWRCYPCSPASLSLMHQADKEEGAVIAQIISKCLCASKKHSGTYWL